MKKFIIKETGEEVKVGNVVSISTTRNTSFGTLITKERLTLNESSLKRLIRLGVISVVEDTSEINTEISFYINLLANQMNKSAEEVIDMLEAMNKVCPRAVLDLLLNTIAIHLYNDNPEAFDAAEHYYSIKLYDGTCGEVHKIHGNIPLFKSKTDVEIARTILRDQLKFMYGEQKGN